MQFKNEAPYIEEWLQFHMLVGVDHFYLYDDASTDNYLEILNPYIEKGLVELYPSPKVSGMEHSWEPRQLASYQDAVTRAQGNAEWIALIDCDEILIPMGEENLPKILANRFSKADGIYVNWRNFGTSGKTIPKGKPLFLELTRCSDKRFPRNWIGKSLVRPEAVDLKKPFDYVHFFQLLPGKNFVNGNLKPANIVNGLYHGYPRHLDQFIRINHYALRDESYFLNTRMKRNNYGYGDNDGSKRLFLEHYEAFNKKSDKRAAHIIRKHKRNIDDNVWDRS